MGPHQERNARHCPQTCQSGWYRGDGVEGHLLGVIVRGETAGEAFNGGLEAGLQSVVAKVSYGGRDRGSEDETAVLVALAGCVLSDEE